MAVEVHENHVTVAGLRTYYWQAGDGPVLLMLHGQLPGSWAGVEWEDQVRRCAEAGFSVYAPDVPGFGQADVARHALVCFSKQTKTRGCRALRLF